MKLNDLSEEQKNMLTETGAFREGHFKLTSGLHSAGYLQCALILQYPNHAEKIARDLAERYSKKPDIVLTPAIGGIVFGQELARALGCRAIFAERKNGELKLRRGFYIEEDEKILLAEDVITTGGSVLELRSIVKNAGARVTGFCVICDRSGGKFVPEEGLESWISLQIDAWEAGDCPLCKKEIPLQKPGSRWK